MGRWLGIIKKPIRIALDAAYEYINSTYPDGLVAY